MLWMIHRDVEKLNVNIEVLGSELREIRDNLRPPGAK
jgi:hypothetical protein